MIKTYFIGGPKDKTVVHFTEPPERFRAPNPKPLTYPNSYSTPDRTEYETTIYTLKRAMFDNITFHVYVTDDYEGNFLEYLLESRLIPETKPSNVRYE